MNILKALVYKVYKSRMPSIVQVFIKSQNHKEKLISFRAWHSFLPE